jgi:KEOPS complex subunit Cgi121
MELIRGHLSVDDVDATLETMAAIAERTGATVQLVDARYVVDETQVALAVELATAAMAEDRQIADAPAIELLVYLAGTRQIDRALQLSLDPAVETYLAVISGGDGETARAAVTSELFDAVEPVQFTPDVQLVRRWYDIGDPELAVTDGDIEGIVRERVAMMPTTV